MVDNKKRLLYWERRVKELKCSIFGQNINIYEDDQDQILMTNKEVEKLENFIKDLEPKVAQIPYNSIEDIENEIRAIEEGESKDFLLLNQIIY